jgi:hypothetical protein
MFQYMSLEHLFADLENLTSKQAQSKLPKLSFTQYIDYLIIDNYHISKEVFCENFEDLREMSALTSLYKEKMYINYLCARGDIDSLTLFLSEQKEDITILLNTYFGSSKLDVYLLHTVLYWNTGEIAIKLFDLLYSYGCKIKLNSKKLPPWENTSTEWISPLTPFKTLGLRNRDEFRDTTYSIKIKYYDFLDLLSEEE